MWYNKVSWCEAVVRAGWGACMLALFALPGTAGAESIAQCMHKALLEADDAVTLGELRAFCREQTAPRPEPVLGEEQAEEGALGKRLAQERKNVLKPFSILPHRPNYLLPLALNSSRYNAEYHQANSDDDSIRFDQLEAQFQLSIKSPIVVGLFDTRTDIYAAYTNHSFWQVYNDDISSPFRETNHEPELWIQVEPQWTFFGWTNSWDSFGINHQSNGQSGALSRSWNRLFATFMLERGNLAFSLTPWYRLPESEATDDNPDITDYLGHCEFQVTYKNGENTFNLMTRNNFESGFSRGAVQLSWSFPLWEWRYLRGYIQYFNGYGESLIDYNEHVNRLGIGLSLTDWL